MVKRLTLSVIVFVTFFVGGCIPGPPGPQGPAGPAGSEGPRGPAGSTTEIEKRLADVEKKLKPEGDPLKYQVDYIFGDFDPAPDKREENARMLFCQDLGKALDGWIGRGFQITPLKSTPLPSPTAGECRNLIQPDRLFGFTLMNAQASLSTKFLTHEKEINAKIKELAERHDPDLAVPVRVDPEDAPLLVRREARMHRATSGVGKATAAAACEQTVNITLSGVAKPGAGIDYVVADIEGEVKVGVETVGDTIIHQGLPCEGVTKVDDYILVILQNPIVAQYRHLEIEVNASASSNKPDVQLNEMQLPVPLIEGAPACPPSDVPEWAAKHFRKRLEARGGCM